MSFLSFPTFTPPAGEPGGLMAAATLFGWTAESLADHATSIAYSVSQIPGWNGLAFDAAIQQSTTLGLEVRNASDAMREAGQVTQTLAQQIAETQALSRSAQERAVELANWAAGIVNPVYGLFTEVTGIASSANDRANDAKRAATNAYIEIVQRAPHYVPPPPPPESDQSHRGLFSQVGHALLDVAGLVPVIGEPADIVNAAWYEAEGDHLNAALSLASAVPIAGWGAAGAKWGKRTIDAYEGARSIDRVNDARRVVEDFHPRELPTMTPHLGGAERVPPVDPAPPLGNRHPGRQQTTQPGADPVDVTGLTNSKIPTGFDRQPVHVDRPGLAEALRDNARLHPPKPKPLAARPEVARPGHVGSAEASVPHVATPHPSTHTSPQRPVTPTHVESPAHVEVPSVHDVATPNATPNTTPTHVESPTVPAPNVGTMGTPGAGTVGPTAGAAVDDAVAGADALRPLPNPTSADSWAEGPRLAGELNAAAHANNIVAPYSQVWSVRDFRTTHPEEYVRVYFEGGSQQGSWLARKQDLLNLTPDQVVGRLALPVAPGAGALKIQTVTVPAGTRMRQSVVGPHVGVEHDGLVFDGLGDIVSGNQFQVFDRLPEDAFSAGQLIDGVVR